MNINLTDTELQQLLLVAKWVGIDSSTLAHNLLIDAVQEIVEASTGTLKKITQGLGSAVLGIRPEDAAKFKVMVNKLS